MKKIVPLILERIDTYGDVETVIKAGEFSYFFEEPNYEPVSLNWKNESDKNKTKAHLEKTLNLFHFYNTSNIRLFSISDVHG